MMLPVRQAAIECLSAVLHSGLRADALLESYTLKVDQRDRGLLHELLYGCLRRFFSLEADYSRFCKSKPDAQVQCALLTGTYQIRYMRIPAHAAVSETVDAIGVLQPEAKGFVNAVLRKVADSVPPAKLKPHQRAELPKWLYGQWRNAFGAEVVQQCCEALKQPPALSVAVFSDRDRWISGVRDSGIEAMAGAHSPYAVLLPGGTDPAALPGFAEGVFTVIDQAAQAAVLALDVENPQLIVELCAAPGGKTAMLAHRFPNARILAVELNSRRMPRLRENLARLSCSNVELVQADAMRLPLPDACADALFLDAPCSASGVLRRHPDAKFLHDAEDVAKLASVQKAMLAEAMRTAKPGSRLVYVVCSIHPEENEQVIAELEGVERVERLFPALDHDGFFHAAIKKGSLAP